MGNQSARMYFAGNDHKDIYFNGHFHDMMYLGNELVWKKLEGIEWSLSETTILGLCSGNGILLGAKLITNGIAVYYSENGIDWIEGGNTNTLTEDNFATLMVSVEIIYLNDYFYIFATSYSRDNPYYRNGVFVYKTYDGKEMERIKYDGRGGSSGALIVSSGPCNVFFNGTEVLVMPKPSVSYYLEAVMHSYDCINWEIVNEIENPEYPGNPSRNIHTFDPTSSTYSKNMSYENGYWYFVGRVFDLTINKWRTGRVWKTKDFKTFEEELVNNVRVDETNWSKVGNFIFLFENFDETEIKYRINGKWSSLNQLFGITELNGIKIVPESSSLYSISEDRKVYNVRFWMENRKWVYGLIFCENGLESGEFFEVIHNCKSILKLEDTYFAYIEPNIVYTRKE